VIGGTIGMGYYRLPGFISQVCHSNAPVCAIRKNVRSIVAQFWAFGKPFLAIECTNDLWEKSVILSRVKDLVPAKPKSSCAESRSFAFGSEWHGLRGTDRSCTVGDYQACPNEGFRLRSSLRFSVPSP